MIRLATVFSGIGAVEEALLKQNKKYKIVFACDNGEREITIDDVTRESLKDLNNEDRNKIITDLYNKTGKVNYVKESYFANFKIDHNSWYEDIRFIDGNQYKNKVDLFVGGSPCQSFSIIGKRKGLEDARGTLFYDYARLIKEIQPKVFIFENVTGMLKHNNGETWKTIKSIFESLNYTFYYDVLNAKDFGIPQDRKRLFVVGFKNKRDFAFPKPTPLTTTTFDFLEKKPIFYEYYLGEKGFKFVTGEKYKNRAKVDSKIIRTQKANQQFNWNGDFIFEPLEKIENDPKIMSRAYVGNWNGQTGVIRQMTNRECLRLMGFDDSFKIVVNKTQSYRQSGNSIVVNVLEALIKQIEKAENIDYVGK